MKKLLTILLLLSAVIIGIQFIYDKTAKIIVYNSYAKSSDYLILVNRNHTLNSDYIPENLTTPNIEFASSAADEEKRMQGEAAKALEQLFKGAKKENIKLYGLSGYRSYESQKQVYDTRVKKVGKKQADEYVAHPGASEH